MASMDICTTFAAGESSTHASLKATEKKQVNVTAQKCPAEVVALGAQRDKCAPISRLPTEIMSNIFLAVKELTETDAMNNFRYTRSQALQGWINVSHVSSAWRKIAVDFSALWTEPPFWNEHWAEEMIKRSKHCALTIRVESQPSPRILDLAKQTLLGHKESVRELHIRNWSNWTQYGFLEALSTGYVRLEKLCIDGSPYRPFLLTATIFSEANKLSKVVLNDCIAYWALNLPPSITILELRKVMTGSPSTWLQLINTLEGLQSLEVLSLTDAVDCFFNQIDDCRLHQVNLPKLRSLSVSFSVDEAASFFRYITFPSTTCLTVTATHTRTASNGIPKVKEMLIAIGQCYAHGQFDPPLHDLIIQCAFSREIMILFEIADTDRGPNKVVRPLWLEINFEELDSNGFHDLVSAVFNSGLPMQDIRSASITDLEDMTPLGLAKTLGCLPNLSRISIQSTTVEIFLQALGLQAGDSKELYFADLSVLELETVEFYGERDGNDDFLSALQNSLIQRYEHNAEITHLILTRCLKLDGGMVERLKEIVVDVDWDGEEIYDYDGFEFTWPFYYDSDLFSD